MCTARSGSVGIADVPEVVVHPGTESEHGLAHVVLVAPGAFNGTSELPVKIFTDSGKFTNVHAKNIHWCMQGPYIGLYRPITVKTNVSSQS